jgi:polyphosphate kinase
LWARRLEEAGVHVVYGMAHHKVHSKMALVVRRDEDCIRRYLHLGTGNYNPSTAKIYTDLSLLTAAPEFGEDATNLFNLLTGIGQFQGATKFLIAPFTLQERILAMIHAETEAAREGKPARIIAKMNGLVDRDLIEAMYAASTAGVEIDLIVRGMCCLRPGIPGVSERIRVRSIIGRFLEHSRVYCFENQGKPLVYVGSADWMPRNLHNRVEVVFPIEDPSLKSHLINDILLRFLEDNTRSWRLLPDASYQRIVPAPDAEPISAQAEFMEAALHSNRKRSSRGTPRARMISTVSTKSAVKTAVKPAAMPKKRAKRAEQNP